MLLLPPNVLRARLGLPAGCWAQVHMAGEALPLVLQHMDAQLAMAGVRYRTVIGPTDGMRAIQWGS